jgi:hypothetical protein
VSHCFDVAIKCGGHLKVPTGCTVVGDQRRKVEVLVRDCAGTFIGGCVGDCVGGCVGAEVGDDVGNRVNC